MKSKAAKKPTAKATAKATATSVAKGEKPKALKSVSAAKKSELRVKAIVAENWEGKKVPFADLDSLGSLEIDAKQARDLAAWLKEYAAWSDKRQKKLEKKA